VKGLVMATPVKLKTGQWRAQIRRVGFKEVTKQFATKSAAAAWIYETEKDMKAGVSPESKTQTISTLIAEYRKMRGVNRPIADKSTEDYTLNILDRTLGDTKANKLTVDAIAAWAQERMDDDVGGYKINCDLSKLGTVLRYTMPALLAVVDASRPKLDYLGLICGNKQRERRPTSGELTGILAWLGANEGALSRDFVEFAGLTAMRRGEIADLRWDDLNTQDRIVLVRNRKDPRQKIGNDQFVPLLAGSFEIVQRQERTDDLIFPIRGKQITKVFHDACVALDIVDLHFHDLRHHGISLMFEHGYDIHQVSIVSGHKNWAHLKRYTQIKPTTLHSLDTRQGTLLHPETPQIVFPPPRMSELETS
jgi:integrase